MKFETTRIGALKKLEHFVENDILNYSSKRNFDFGVDNRKNVSCLSPYITHRLITEYETVKLVLNKHPYQKEISRFKKFYGEFIGKDGLNLDQRSGLIL